MFVPMMVASLLDAAFKLLQSYEKAYDIQTLICLEPMPRTCLGTPRIATHRSLAARKGVGLDLGVLKVVKLLDILYSVILQMI